MTSCRRACGERRLIRRGKDAAIHAGGIQMYATRARRGFSLIELVIVVVIIGV